jgi:[ribosomal protein S5]-alanine N-acetyltransferase
MTLDAAFARFPILTTERLRLRQLQPTDAEALFAIKSNLEVTRHYGQEPHQSLADSVAWIERLHASYARREDFAWGVTLKDKDTLIGACTLWNFGPGLQCAEIGYELHPAYEKRGIMTEALSVILTFGFTKLGLHRIEATPFVENSSSQNLLRKLGFIHEGTLRQRHFFRGHYLDQMVFGLLKDDCVAPS